MHSKLHFSPTPLTLGIGIAVLTVVAFLCVLAVHRSSNKSRMTLLEMLRLLATAFVVLLLWQPEWLTVIEPTTKPRIALLWDDSRSMETLDVQMPQLFSPSKEITARKTLVEKIIGSDTWKSLSADGKNELIVRPFSTPPADSSASAAAGTDLFTPLDDVLEKETNLRATILLSDGDWNQGVPPVTAAQKYRLRHVPLYTVPIGSASSLPDLDVISVSAPTYAIVGENLQIPFTIKSSLNREVRTTVRLKDGSKERTKDIVIPPHKTTHETILWKLEKEGSHTLELSLPVTNGELISSNNSRKFTISGKPEKIRVLVVETLPRWEYRYLRNALSRDPGVELSCLLFHPDLGLGDGPDYIQKFPDKIEELAKYDVIMLGDVGVGDGELTKEQCTLIRGLVENQASGLVFLPGSQGKIFSLLDTDLADLIPVLLDSNKKNGLTENQASPLALTTEGASSLLTMLGDTEEDNPIVWKSLPGFYWHAPIERAKAGTTVLAVHANRSSGSYGRIPLIVTKNAGSGKILLMGIDSAWRWRRGVEDKYHYRFWGQVARWMSYQRNMAAGSRLRLYFTPERPAPGDSVTLKANAFDKNGAPLTDSTVLLTITAPDKSTQSLELTKEENAWGSFTGKLAITQPGEWKISASIAGENSPTPLLSTTILSQAVDLEKIGQPAKPEVLQELSKISQARSIQAENIPELIKEINTLPEPRPIENRIPLWNHWITIAALVTLLASFWIMRKFGGLF